MITDGKTTEYDVQKYLLVVIAALTPCFMMGVYVFGLDMLDNMLGGCGVAVLLTRILGKKSEPELLAAAISGALIVFGTPSTLPIWIVLIGVAIAVIPVGLLFDRLKRADESTTLTGRSLTSETQTNTTFTGASLTGTYLLERAVISAAVAQVAIWALFREQMNTWPLNDFVETRVSPGDIATGMTPLEILADGGDLPGLSRMFVGFISGPCGEVSVAAAVIGGVYLIYKKIISPVIPVLVLATVLAVAFAYYMAAIPSKELAEMAGSSGAGAAMYLAFYQVLAGGTAFGAFFLAPAICLPGTVSFPVKTSAAVGVGLITMLLRVKGIYIEGMAAPVVIIYIILNCCYFFAGFLKKPLLNKKKEG